MSTPRAQSERDHPAGDLAPFVADLEAADVPEEGLRLAERCFVDTVGVALAGAVDDTGQAAASALDDASGDVTLLGRDGTAPVATAAFVNGTAGHALDFDDVSDAMSGHPSVTLVPATLAVGEHVGATGRDALAAFVAGFETICYLGAPILPDHYEVGWHATATLGAFGCAAAAANLLDLDTGRTRHALDVAASMPAGLKRNFGTATKPVHAGQAARSGVTAALLAAEGIDADEAAIDGDRGFFDLYADAEADLDALYALGEHWAVVEAGVGIKKFPCCYFTHSPIEAASRLADEHGVEADDVEAVRVRASRGAGDALHHADPETGLEAKFSMEYTVASGLVRDRVGLDAFEDAAVDDPDVQRVRERVDFRVDSDLPYGSHESTVAVETVGGESHSLTLPEPPGTHDDPLSDEELETKFHDCATRAIDEEAATAAYERLDSLRDATSVAAAIEGL